jgi:hypothetical protein
MKWAANPKQPNHNSRPEEVAASSGLFYRTITMTHSPDPDSKSTVIIGRCEYRLTHDRIGVLHRLVGNHTYLQRDPQHPSPDEKTAYQALLAMEAANGL